MQKNEIIEAMSRMSPSGHYLALRLRFCFPMEERNCLPSAWVKHYAQNRMLLADPALRWSYHHNGVIGLDELADVDRAGILDQAREFGLRHGTVASIGEVSGVRSYGVFYRPDRQHTDVEKEHLLHLTTILHRHSAPPSTLTNAEIEVLIAIKGGQRIKSLAHDLGVTEGAIKQRLKNARVKLGANTAAQAATMASGYGLI